MRVMLQFNPSLEFIYLQHDVKEIEVAIFDCESIVWATPTWL